MPTPTIPDGELFFNATTYTGNGTAGRVITVPSINNVGFAWVKLRSGSDDHRLANTVTGGNKHLKSNAIDAESTGTNVIQAFSGNTFTVGSDVSVNGNGSTYVGWTWADGGAAVTNTAGTISSQVSANTTSGFSVVTYTGNGSSSATVGHGLGVAPSMIIVKSRSATTSWFIRHSSLTAGYQLRFTTDAQEQVSSATTAGGLGSGTSSVINFIAGSINVDNVNASAATYVAYCWAPIAGYSAFGSYTGNGSADGPFIYTGFRPRFILTKASSATSSWYLRDTARSANNVAVEQLYPDLSNAEANETGMDILSNGFKQRGTSSGFNASGTTYIYMAFAENPFKYANAR